MRNLTSGGLALLRYSQMPEVSDIETAEEIRCVFDDI